MQNQELWKQYFEKYPLGTMQDFIKYLYQAVLGSAHFVSNPEENYQYLFKEYQTLECDENHELIEEISDDLVRVHLEAIPAKYLKYYHHFFLLSVDVDEDKQKLIDLLMNIAEVPIDKNEWKAYVSKYIQEGCPVASHSDIFREHYHPHYRLMKKKYIPYIKLLKRIEQIHCPILAIDGNSAAGKSSLAELLSETLELPVISMDDFFLQAHQRTSHRLQEVGGNIDYERFYHEVVQAITNGTNIVYQVFDCSCMQLAETKSIDCRKGLIIEGCYSHHPYFKEYANLKIFMGIDKIQQKERILKRNGEKMLKRFVGEWIPKEDAYFEMYHIKENADVAL